jgi:hypothetical protein
MLFSKVLISVVEENENGSSYASFGVTRQIILKISLQQNQRSNTAKYGTYILNRHVLLPLSFLS